MTRGKIQYSTVQQPSRPLLLTYYSWPNYRETTIVSPSCQSTNPASHQPSDERFAANMHAPVKAPHQTLYLTRCKSHNTTHHLPEKIRLFSAYRFPSVVVVSECHDDSYSRPDSILSNSKWMNHPSGFHHACA